MPALISGTVPKGVTEIGAPVNPVHVLDLAFILPIVTAISARLGRPLGLLFAAQLPPRLHIGVLTLDERLVLDRVRDEA